MKRQILNILKNSNERISGVELSARLGISRVSIWKHMGKLQDAGYDIGSTPKGYILQNDNDLLYPWEFPQRESNINYFSELDSTMDKARELATSGCPDFTVVIAGTQRKGRGRLKRSWHSSEGGLYFTIVLRPNVPPPSGHKYNFATSLVLARTLRNLFGIDAMVKWPNDILVGGKKLSGMLSEMEAEADRVSFINIGIGLNVNNDPETDEPNAVSLKKLVGKELSRKKILSVFLDNLEEKFSNMESETIISEWKEYSLTLNRRVTIITPKDVCEGIAVDVDEEGALILKLDNGTLKRVIYGDCFLKE